jgi:hypothetical protein
MLSCKVMVMLLREVSILIIQRLDVKFPMFIISVRRFKPGVRRNTSRIFRVMDSTWWWRRVVSICINEVKAVIIIASVIRVSRI